MTNEERNARLFLANKRLAQLNKAVEDTIAKITKLEELVCDEDTKEE